MKTQVAYHALQVSARFFPRNYLFSLYISNRRNSQNAGQRLLLRFRYGGAGEVERRFVPLVFIHAHMRKHCL